MVKILLESIGIKEKETSQMDVLVTFTTLLTRFWSNSRWLKVSIKLVMAISKHLNRSIKHRCASISSSTKIAHLNPTASLLMVLQSLDNLMILYLKILLRVSLEPVFRTLRPPLANSGRKAVIANLVKIAHSTMVKRTVDVLLILYQTYLKNWLLSPTLPARVPKERSIIISQIANLSLISTILLMEALSLVQLV